MNIKNKYLKYKSKYLELKNLIGGTIHHKDKKAMKKARLTQIIANLKGTIKHFRDLISGESELLVKLRQKKQRLKQLQKEKLEQGVLASPDKEQEIDKLKIEIAQDELPHFDEGQLQKKISLLEKELETEEDKAQKEEEKERAMRMEDIYQAHLEKQRGEPLLRVPLRRRPPPPDIEQDNELSGLPRLFRSQNIGQRYEYVPLHRSQQARARRRRDAMSALQILRSQQP